MKILKLTSVDGRPIAFNAESIAALSPALDTGCLWDKTFDKEYQTIIHIIGANDFEVREKFVTVVSMLESLQ